MVIFLIIIFGHSLGLTSAQLSIHSAGVDYTNSTFYAPYGTTVILSCEGSSGSKNWQIVSGIGVLDIPTSGDTVQRAVGQIQELVIMNFGAATAVPYLCHDIGGTHPSVSIELSQGVIITPYTISSTSVQLLWEPEQENTAVTGECCLASSCDTSVPASSRLNTGSVTISGLEEFTQYVCTISGMSRSVMVNTSSDKPSGPPLNVALTVQDITTLQLSWSIPNKADRNGDIIRYHVECFGEGIPSGPTSTKSTSATFSNLQPFTDYGCRVAATTVNGTGPYSMFENRTTPEGVPGPVDTINVTKLNNDNRVEVSWGAPNPLNGVIIRYVVKYRIHDSQDDTTLQTTDNSQKIETNALSQGVPYSLVVIAETRAGLGKESQRKVFFSRELAPTKNVASVTGVRVSDSEMMVSWTGLTLREARGFPSYTITYEPVGSTGRVSRQAQTVQTEQTSTTVGGLMSEAEYSVHVTVSTDGGSSAASEPVTVPMFRPPPPSGPNTSTESPTSVGVAVAMVMVVVIIVVGAIALAVSGVIFVVHIRKRSTHSSSDVEYAVDDSHINMQENPAYATVSCSAQTSPSAPNYENVQ